MLHTEDQYHIILEYRDGDKWGDVVSKCSNRFILTNDVPNGKMSSIEVFFGEWTSRVIFMLSVYSFPFLILLVLLDGSIALFHVFIGRFSLRNFLVFQNFFILSCIIFLLYRKPYKVPARPRYHIGTSSAGESKRGVQASARSRLGRPSAIDFKTRTHPSRTGEHGQRRFNQINRQRHFPVGRFRRTK